MSAPGNYPPPYGPPPEPPRKRHTARNVLLSVLAGVVAVLIGVAVSDSGGAGGNADGSTDPAAAEPAGAGPELNEHGNIPAALGQPAEITDRDGTPIANVTVTAVTADPATCSDFNGMAPPPKRGHTLLIELHIETTANVDGTWLFNRLYLSVIGPNGNTESSQAAMLDCGGQAPPNLGPSQAANAQIVLDSSHTSGALVYRPIFAGDVGWEWSF